MVSDRGNTVFPAIHAHVHCILLFMIDDYNVTGKLPYSGKFEGSNFHSFHG